MRSLIFLFCVVGSSKNASNTGPQSKAFFNQSHLGVTNLLKGCRSESDCDANNAEICHNRQCVHLGWVSFLDSVIYVNEDRGWVSVPIVRYGWADTRLQTVVSVKVVSDNDTSSPPMSHIPFTETAVNFVDVANATQSSDDWDYKLEPGTAKFWGQWQQGIRLLNVYLNDDAAAEDSEEISLRLHPETNAFLRGQLDCKVVILGPSDVQSGTVGFSQLEYRVEESSGRVALEVTRIGGSAGPISVEYSVSSRKTGGEASFGRDYAPFGVWTRILHHECDYLRPVGDAEQNDKVTDKLQTKRYFDRVQEWFEPLMKDRKRRGRYSSCNWLGSGCCSVTDTPFTYPRRRLSGLFDFRLSWNLNRGIDDVVWQQYIPPNMISESMVGHTSLAVMTGEEEGSKGHNPVGFTGLSLCEVEQKNRTANNNNLTAVQSNRSQSIRKASQCRFRGNSKSDGFLAFEVGQRTPLLTDPQNPLYQPRGCLHGPITAADGVTAVDSVSLWVKRRDLVGTLYWPDGDSDPRTIEVDIIDDDIYEKTERFVVTLSPHIDSHPVSDSLIIRESHQRTVVVIEGPNDVKAGTIGFGESTIRTEEGTELCIPVIREGGSDENVYLRYSCEMGTATDYDGGPTNHRDLEWITPKLGQMRWQTGENHTQCINVRIVHDQVYEPAEDFACYVSRVWGDDAVKYAPTMGVAGVAIEIAENDDQIRVNTPWLIVKEGWDAMVTVQRQGFRGKDVSIHYWVSECESSVQCKGHTQESFASAGRDFANISGELWFYANESFAEKQLNIPIISDGQRELTEAFLFRIRAGQITDTVVDSVDLPFEDTDPTMLNRQFTRFDLFADRAQIWIHGPNDLPQTSFEFVMMSTPQTKVGGSSTATVVQRLDTLHPLILAEPPLLNWSSVKIGVRRTNDNGSWFDYITQATVACVQYTALEDVDFTCDHTGLLEWDDTTTSKVNASSNISSEIRWINVSVFNDQHWENSESFTIELSHAFNGNISENQRVLTVEIPANDEPKCELNQHWSAWSECPVQHGTAQESRSRMSIQSDPATFTLTCVNLTEHRWCQRDSSGLPALLNFSRSQVVLLEDHVFYARQRINVTLGGMPLMNALNMAAVDSEENGGCVVRVQFAFHIDSDVIVEPDSLCWMNDSWALPKELEISVLGNHDVDDQAVRKRQIDLRTIYSVDPAYQALNAQDYGVEVFVIDDEVCEESAGCYRADQSPPEIIEDEYEDSYEYVQLSKLEVSIALALFILVVLTSVGLRVWFAVQKYHRRRKLLALEQQRQQREFEQGREDFTLTPEEREEEEKSENPKETVEGKQELTDELVLERQDETDGLLSH